VSHGPSAIAELLVSLVWWTKKGVDPVAVAVAVAVIFWLGVIALSSYLILIVGKP